MNNFFNVNKILLWLISIFFTIGCCKEAEICTKNISNKISSVETIYNCDDSINEMQLISDLNYQIILDNETYNNQVSGICHPPIDFEKYNLIIGKNYSFNKISKFEYEFYETCESGIYKLFIKPKKEMNILLEKFYYYHILIPKDVNIVYLKIITVQ